MLRTALLSSDVQRHGVWRTFGKLHRDRILVQVSIIRDKIRLVEILYGYRIGLIIRRESVSALYLPIKYGYTPGRSVTVLCNVQAQPLGLL